MACSNYTLKGIASACKNSIGGVKAVFVAMRAEASNVLTGSVSDGILTPTSGFKSAFKKYAVRKSSSSATSTLQTSDTAGNTWQTELSLQFMKQDAAKRNEIMALCSEETIVIFVDGNGNGWVLGWDYPVEVSAGTAETGTAMSDLNGYNLTLTDNSIELPYQLDNTSVTELLTVE